MEIVLDKDELKRMFDAVADIAVSAFKAELKPESDLITQREACRRYKRSNVERWRRSGLLDMHRNGSNEKSNIYYSNLQLKTIYNSEKFQILN